jgi:putative hemolysin
MEILIIIGLVICNGILAMSEAAVIASRQARLEKAAQDEQAGAGAALKLVKEPDDFLSTVQIGITLVGIMAGAFGGASVAGDLRLTLIDLGLPDNLASAIAPAIVIGLTTYLSLIIGELVPKRLAMRNPEAISSRIAPPMRVISRLTFPIVWFLSRSTQFVLTLMGIKADDTPPVTEDEIRTMVAQGHRHGVLQQHEEEMIAGVFRLDDLQAEALMTPRVDTVWLDVSDDVETIKAKLKESDYAYFPVVDGSPDEVVGVVSARKLLIRALNDDAIDLHDLADPPLYVPESLAGVKVLDRFRSSGVPFAIVISEHGGMNGVITVRDVIESVVGEIDQPDAVQRDDGSYLVDGLMPWSELLDRLNQPHKVEIGGPRYHTVAGFIVAHLDRIPQAADVVESDTLRFEVMDMDGRRVDKVLVRITEPEADDSDD